MAGWLAVVATFGVCLVTNDFVDAQWGKDYYSNHLWIVGLAVLVGGLITAAIGFALKPLTERELIDPKTDERVVVQSASDTFFFIPLHWAGCVIAALGVYAILHDVFD